ncbi:hypothetical protein [Exiguobacterium profundum]|uniref:hypothetical protein n=1 Tax=Exiguobacterium profundum TaxID=307643 RepID=UPI00093BE092|nr:hypothetical protein [Exiguobacterium profundum]
MENIFLTNFNRQIDIMQNFQVKSFELPSETIENFNRQIDIMRNFQVKPFELPSETIGNFNRQIDVMRNFQVKPFELPSRTIEKLSEQIDMMKNFHLNNFMVSPEIMDSWEKSMHTLVFQEGIRLSEIEKDIDSIEQTKNVLSDKTIAYRLLFILTSLQMVGISFFESPQTNTIIALLLASIFAPKDNR